MGAAQRFASVAAAPPYPFAFTQSRSRAAVELEALVRRRNFVLRDKALLLPAFSNCRFHDPPLVGRLPHRCACDATSVDARKQDEGVRTLVGKVRC